jgi:helix-turn-helix protein
LRAEEVLKMKKNNMEELADRICKKEIAHRVMIENLIKVTIYGSRL